MLAIPHNILERAREGCQELIDRLKTMPMSNIVNTIEQTKACQIFIKPIEKPKIPNTCLATCNISILAGKEEGRQKRVKKRFRHHFIHYEKSDNKELERIRVAHELGHCFFYWLPKGRNNKLYIAKIPDTDIKLYLVKFELIDERLADAFASIMVNYPFSTSEKYPNVTINKKLLDKIEEYKTKGYLQSPYFK